MASSDGTATATTPAAPRLIATRTMNWIAPVLVIVGLQLWLLMDKRLVRTKRELLLIAVVAAASMLPPGRRVILAVTGWLRAARGLAVVAIVLVIWVGSALYFHHVAVAQQRMFAPLYHDEFSYQLQATMLAHGRLWAPKHELADFFDSYYVIVDPVYASMYFPGTAMLMVPGVWLGIAPWLTMLALSGATVALAYLLFRHLLDGAAGVLAALMFVALPAVRMVSIMSLSSMPALFLGLLIVWSWVRFRTYRRTGWLVLAGVATGWLAISRPVDALVFTLPTTLLAVIDLWRDPWRTKLRIAAVVCAAAMPFLPLQLVFNKGVTGSWLRTPFAMYNDRDYPNVGFGFPAFDPEARPQSRVLQKQVHYAETVRPMLAAHTPASVARDWVKRRYRWIAQEAMPESLLIVFAPFALFALRDPRYLPVVLLLPVFVLLYSPYPFFLPHYLIIVAPAMTILVLLGVRTLETAWPMPWGPRLYATGFALATSLTVVSLPEFDRSAADISFYSDLMPRVAELLDKLEHKPAVVLFTYRTNDQTHEEPVYNPGVVWPDDAPVIRAHDLGERNVEIFRYYAKHLPQRAFYRYDRTYGTLTFLGYAKDLAGAGVTDAH